MPVPQMVFRGRRVRSPAEFRLSWTARLALTAGTLVLASVALWAVVLVESNQRATDRFLDAHGVTTISRVVSVVQDDNGRPLATVAFDVPSQGAVTADLGVPSQVTLTPAEQIEVTYAPQNFGLLRFTACAKDTGRGPITAAIVVSVVAVAGIATAVFSGLLSRRWRRHYVAANPTASGQPALRRPPGELPLHSR